MSAAQTLGPFTACDPGDYSDFDGRSIVILTGEMDRRVAVVQGDDAEAVATARLFASSPDLVVRLQAAAERMHAAARGIEARADSLVSVHKIASDTLRQHANWLRAESEAASAALAKAQGATS